MTTGEGERQGRGCSPSLASLGLTIGIGVRVDHGHNEPAQVHDEAQHGPHGVLLARFAFGHTGSLERIPAAAPHEPTDPRMPWSTVASWGMPWPTVD